MATSRDGWMAAVIIMSGWGMHLRVRVHRGPRTVGWGWGGVGGGMGSAVGGGGVPCALVGKAASCYAPRGGQGDVATGR